MLIDRIAVPPPPSTDTNKTNFRTRTLTVKSFLSLHSVFGKRSRLRTPPKTYPGTRGATKNANTNDIRIFRSKVLIPVSSINAPSYISNRTFHNDCRRRVAKERYDKFHSRHIQRAATASSPLTRIPVIVPEG